MKETTSQWLLPNNHKTNQIVVEWPSLNLCFKAEQVPMRALKKEESENMLFKAQAYQVVEKDLRKL